MRSHRPSRDVQPSRNGQPSRNALPSRNVLRRAAAAVLACVTVAAGLAACSGDSPGPPVSDTEVRAALARHAYGVLHHDRSDFLAAIGDQHGAAAFRSAQQAQYDNLSTVALGSWSYSLGPTVTDRTAQAAARTRWGSSARIVRLELHYALRGVDPRPVEHDLWWTFTREGGHAAAVADDALARQGGVSWTGPWDFGPMTAVNGSTAVVLGRADLGPELRQVAGEVAAAVPAVTAVWGSDWTRRVAVIVAPTTAAFAAALGTPPGESPPSDVAAVAVDAGTEPLSGDPLEQRLVIDPTPFDRLSTLGRRITLTHEITHLASAKATTGNTPRWLVEGLAEYVANLHTGQSVPVAAAELRAELRAGRVPSALPDDASLSGVETGTGGDDATAAAAYQQAWLACRLIAARIGAAGLVRLYRQVGASAEDTDTAVATAVRRNLHESVARFTAEWRASLRSELG